MTSRRRFLTAGLSALALGLLVRRTGAAGLVRALPGSCAEPVVSPPGRTDPLIAVPRMPPSVQVDGMPFRTWFTGDSFDNLEIPFHTISNPFGGPGPPEPEEKVDVAVVGGGLSGLATAYLLRHRRPVVFELRERFGGNALGETWSDIPYSLGSAYVITPDEGSFLEELYGELGLVAAHRESFPPDPVELRGKIVGREFWSGALAAPEDRIAYERYAAVVLEMADRLYPEIPVPDDPDEIARIHALDRKSFREDLVERMGVPLPTLLEAGVQSYFYSSFGEGMEGISAASGWNFVAAEEYGRWVFPGGNAYMARSLWRELLKRQSELDAAGAGCGPLLRAGCRVIDVRPAPARRARGRVQLTYVDAGGTLRSLLARHVVMAGSKHVVKHVLFDIENWSPSKLDAMNHVSTSAYLVANVLLEAPVERDFYDLFLLGDESFPTDPGAVEQAVPIVDVIRGDYTNPTGPRSVLTLYWPLPWPSARFTLLLGQPWQAYAERAVPQIREMLRLLSVPESAVRQVRLTRWGHAMPIARPWFIAQGFAERFQTPLDGNVHFVNQDNWALPAVENSLLDAQTVAARIDAALK
jgi:hypothetical protein